MKPQYEETRHKRKLFAREFATDIRMWPFAMGTMESTDKRMAVDFPHNPLPPAWQCLTSDDKEAAEGGGIAMDGDRGVADTLPDEEFSLESTIAGGANLCRPVFTQRQ